MGWTKEDFYWLGGLLEGEGYFGMVTNWVNKKPYRYPRIGVNMTDYDVIERVSKLWNIKIFVMKPAGVSKKIGYRVTLSGKKAAYLMQQIRPLMGERRKNQIDKTLQEYETQVPPNEKRRKACSEYAQTRHRNNKGQFVDVVGFDTATPQIMSDFAKE